MRRRENPVSNLLWGKARFEQAGSLFYFKKGNRVQRLVYQLKYRGREDVGLQLGKLLGRELAETELYKDLDVVVPVPLHFSKKRTRGYNQCDSLAQGVAEVLDIPFIPNVVSRVRANTTQTRKGHFERAKNVDDLFTVNRHSILNNCNVLLLDDVITTGSTLASCARSINKIGNDKVWICTLAISAQ